MATLNGLNEIVMIDFIDGDTVWVWLGNDTESTPIHISQVTIR